MSDEPDPIIERLHGTFVQATESIQSHPTPQWINKVMELLEENMRDLLADVAIEYYAKAINGDVLSSYPKNIRARFGDRFGDRFGVKQEECK